MPLPDDLLREFVDRAPIFVETGSHRGDGVARALEAGYRTIYSVDVSPFAYGWCSHRFADQREAVHLFLDDSRWFLHDLLSTSVGSPATFWLDAHWCGGDGEMQGRDTHVRDTGRPLLGELEVIREHARHDHVILIDDVRMMGADEFFPSLDEVEAALRAINPAYELRRVDGRDHPGDILIAVAP